MPNSLVYLQRVFSDPSPLVSRRLGFATLPLACLVIRVLMQAIGMATRHGEAEEAVFDTPGASVALFGSAPSTDFWHSTRVHWAGIALGSLVCWVCLVAFKIILGISLLNFATRRCAGMEARLAEDEDLNQLARSPLGEAEGERVRCFALSQAVQHIYADVFSLSPVATGRSTTSSFVSLSTTRPMTLPLRTNSAPATAHLLSFRPVRPSLASPSWRQRRQPAARRRASSSRRLLAGPWCASDPTRLFVLLLKSR